MTNPTAAMIVIGDEILSGRTADANMNHLAKSLSEVGIDLKEMRVVSDDPNAIIQAVQTLSATYDSLFTSGGIGPTHDDITADCIAEAFGLQIDINAQAHALLSAYYQKRNIEFNQSRMRMARIPLGAELIENPVSVAPGFIVENVYVMAGVPAIFQAMLASVLPRLTGGAPLISKTYRIERGEGEFAASLAELARNHPKISFGSYPFVENGQMGANIVLRASDISLLELAYSELQKVLPE